MKENFKNYIIYYNEEIKKAIKEIKNPKTFHRQIPNLLTFSRFFSPMVIIPLFLSGNMPAVIIAIGVFGLTDLFDGKLARKFNSTSKFGKDLDAIVDKIFAFSLLFPLILSNHILLASILFETIISITNIKAEFRNLKPYSSRTGKLKTWFLNITILLGYMNILNKGFRLLYNFSFISTILIQAKTTEEYIKSYGTQSKKGSNNSIEFTENSVIDNQLCDEINLENNIEKEKNELEKLKQSLIDDNELIEKKVLIKK